MITISYDQGLTSVDNWEAVLQLPNFVAKLDHKSNPLDTIRGRYQLKPEVHCGLKSCNKPHERGYIVTTKTGLTTNIGQYCGKTHFGVDFVTLAKKFDRDIEEKEMRELLTSFSFRIDELEDKLNEMRRKSKGADWIHKRVAELQTPGNNVPDRVIRTLREMIRNGSATLTKERDATAEEIEVLRATGQRITTPHFVHDPVGSIAGFQALYPDNDLRNLLVLQIEEVLREFKTMNIDVLSHDQLKRWSKWAGSVESILEKAATAMQYGLALLTSDNLEQFNQVMNGDDIRHFRQFLVSLKEE
jgi:hypothetical protein